MERLNAIHDKPSTHLLPEMFSQSLILYRVQVLIAIVNMRKAPIPELFSSAQVRLLVLKPADEVKCGLYGREWMLVCFQSLQKLLFCS